MGRRSRPSESSTAWHLLAFTLATSVLRCQESAAFVLHANPSPRTCSGRLSGRLSMTLGKREASPLTWRQNLELLGLPGTSGAERQILLLNLLGAPPVAVQDVMTAATRGRIVEDIILQEGTEARKLADGVKAVRKQLQEDLLPQLAKEGPAMSRKLASQLTEELPKELKEQLPTAVAAASAAVANPATVLSAARSLQEEASNVFQSTPEGLYTPPYDVVAVGDGGNGGASKYELRLYDSYAVCSTEMAAPEVSKSGAGGDGGRQEEEGEKGEEEREAALTTAASGEGFNTLAGYIFGGNEGGKKMAMTMPVLIDKEQGGGQTMSFVMPKEVGGEGAGGEEAPQPNDPKVKVSRRPKQLVAVATFPGFATEGEVKRQLDGLKDAVQRDGLLLLDQRPGALTGEEKDKEDKEGEKETVPSKGGSTGDNVAYTLLQYNPPYTLPFLRRNELSLTIDVKGSRAVLEGLMDLDGWAEGG